MWIKRVVPLVAALPFYVIDCRMVIVLKLQQAMGLHRVVSFWHVAIYRSYFLLYIFYCYVMFLLILWKDVVNLKVQNTGENDCIHFVMLGPIILFSQGRCITLHLWLNWKAEMVLCVCKAVDRKANIRYLIYNLIIKLGLWLCLLCDWLTSLLYSSWGSWKLPWVHHCETLQLDWA